MHLSLNPYGERTLARVHRGRWLAHSATRAGRGGGHCQSLKPTTAVLDHVIKYLLNQHLNAVTRRVSTAASCFGGMYCLIFFAVYVRAFLSCDMLSSCARLCGVDVAYWWLSDRLVYTVGFAHCTASTCRLQRSTSLHNLSITGCRCFC